MEPICNSFANHPKTPEKRSSNPIRYSSQSNIRRNGNLRGVNDLIRKLSTEYTKNMVNNFKNPKNLNLLNGCHKQKELTKCEKNSNIICRRINNVPNAFGTLVESPQTYFNGLIKSNNDRRGKEKISTLGRIVATQERLQPMKSRQKLIQQNTPTFSNATINGRKIETMADYCDKYVNITNDMKKQIIIAMLKESKIPSSIVPEKDYVNVKNKDSKLEKISENILGDYDVIVQIMDTKPVDNRFEFLPVKMNTRDETYKKSVKSDLIQTKTTPEATLTTNKKINNSPQRLFLRPDNEIFKSKQKYLKKLLIGIRPCTINEIIVLINKYTALTFRNKENRYNLKAINDLHPILNLGRRFISEDEVKSRDRICQIKERLLRLLYSTLNKENNFSPESCSHAPRFFIGRGNNSPLVKSLIRERWWWISAEDLSKPYNLLWTQWRTINFINTLGTLTNPIKTDLPRISNHFEGNYYLGHKKNMYKCLRMYYTLTNKDLSKIVPLTFHIKYGKTDLTFVKFQELYLQNERNIKRAESDNEGPKNVWIIKPGENSNRGNGISVSNNLTEIESYITDLSHTHIIQKYIENPLLFDNRKFDIRCFTLITSVNGYIKAYYYQEGYLRTSSKDYTIDSLAKSVHLTNEAVQIKYEGFGKHEAGNKISYADFQKYLEQQYADRNPPVNFYKLILPKIKVNLS